MKLKLTPELFILQDVCEPLENNHANGQEEKKEKKESIVLKNSVDLDLRLRQINKSRRFIEAPEFRLLNSPNSCPTQSSPFKSENNQLHQCKQQNQNELNQNKLLTQQQQLCKPNNQPPSLASYLPYLFYSFKQNPKSNAILGDKRFIKRRPTRDIIQSDIRCVTLIKEKYGSGFGLTIKGGIEFHKPLVISGIQRGSAADKCRSLFIGDLIVQLNGQPTYPLHLTHEHAMKAIKAGGHKLYLTVKHLTMYNKPIGRMWYRQLDTFMLDQCDNKAEVVGWPTAHQTSRIDSDKMNPSPASFVVKSQFLSDKSSLKENYPMKIPLSSSNQHHLSDSEQYSNCETITLSNLTVMEKDKDELMLTPSPHDEGVYTGLSNDALSSSECTSDASGFSSDYNQPSHNKQPVKNLCSSNYQPKQISSYHKQDLQNEINCSFTTCASSCKNRKNNNRCTKCIVNKNQTTHSHNVNNFSCSSLEQRSADQRSSDFKTSFTEQDKEHSSLNGFSFKSIHTDKQENSYFEQLSAKGSQRNDNKEEHSNYRQPQTKDSQEVSSFSCSVSSNSTSKNSNGANLDDIVSVSLINCYFTKYIGNTDIVRKNSMEVQWFSWHNESGAQCSLKQRSNHVNSAVISFNDTDLAQQFQRKINRYLSKLNESYMFSFSRGLRPQERILFMGWVSFALPKTVANRSNLKNAQQLASALDYKWQPKYMIIRGGELLLYDYVPDYLSSKLKRVHYANDTLIEFNDLSRLLVNQNGALTCSITLNGSSNLNNTKSSSRKSTRLTRHLSIRGRDASLDPSHQLHTNDSRANNKVLSEINNKKRSSSGNRLISTLARNLSLKTTKENQYNKDPADKLKSANPHCTLPRNALIDQQISGKNLKRTDAESNLLKTSDFDLLSQQADRQQFMDSANGQPEVEWENKPIIFKAYQSVLRQLKPEEQLDKRENCLLALTTQSDCPANLNSMSGFEKQPADQHTDELQENSSPNVCYGSTKTCLDEPQQPVSNSSVVAYLAVEHADNIPQILKSWNVCTMHSVIQLSQKSFPVVSEARYGCLTLDWNTGFTLYDGSNTKWSFKFSQLKNSSDDGYNTLWLSFQSIVHQPVRPTINQKPLNAPALTSFSNQSDNNSSLSGSMESMDQYPQRATANHRARTPSSFDSSNINGSTTMNNSTDNNNQLNGYDYYGSLNGSTLQTNRTEFRIKKSIETKELTCSNLQHLIYCMHSFLSAKVTNVASKHNQQLSSNGILV